MSTYANSIDLSSKRLQNINCLRPIKDLDTPTRRNLVDFSASITGRLAQIEHNIDESEYLARQIGVLGAAGIHSARRALVGFGVFDDSKEVKALPMFAGLTTKLNASHGAIWVEYRSIVDGLENKFNPSTNVDMLHWEVFKPSGSDAHIMRIGKRSPDLPATHIEALEKISAGILPVKFHFSLGKLNYLLIENGKTTSFAASAE